MLRTLTKIVAFLGALLLLVVGLLAVGLPRLVESENFQDTLHNAAARALGSPVEWSSLEAGLLPPRIVLASPVLLGPDGDEAEAHLTAESVDLRLAPWPLFKGNIEIDSLVLRGADLVVTRAPEGLVLPIGGRGKTSEAAAAATEGEEADVPTAEPGSSGDDGEFSLALRRVVIGDSRIVVRDRVLATPIEWRLEGFELEARGRSGSDPIDLRASARLATDGREVGGLATAGEVSLGGVYDLDVQLEALLLEELAVYFPELGLAGRASGRVSIDGATSTLAGVDVDLAVADFAYRGKGLELAGELELQAQQALDGPIAFVANLELAERGKARIEGKGTLEGALDAKIDLDGLALAPYSSYAGEKTSLAGRASGRIGLAMTAEGGLTRLTTDLEIPSARYADGSVEIEGALELDLGLESFGENDPIRFDVALDPTSGGHLEAKGTGTRAGAVDVKASFDAVDVELFAPLLQEGTQVDGALSGRLDLRVASDRTIERLDTNLQIASARLVSAPVDVSGSLSLVMGLVDEGPVTVEAGLTLTDGGRLGVTGTTTLDGVVDLDAELEGLDLDVAKPFLPSPEMQIGGLATGKARVVGAASSPEFLSLDVGVEAGLLRLPDYRIEGPFLVDLRVKEPLSGRPRGQLDLDLTAARVEYKDQFKKRAGMRAEMVTKFVPDEKGEIVFESRIKLRNIDEILLQGFIGDSTSVAITTPTFSLDGWTELLPILEPYSPDGPIELEGVGIEWIDGEPARFGGRLQLRGVGLDVAGAGRLRLRGQLLGEGAAIRSQGLKLLVNGLTLSVQGRVEDATDQVRYEIAVRSVGSAEVNDLLNAMTSTHDTLFGPLELEGELKGTARSKSDFYQSLAGQFAFTVGKEGGGRLRGVSILRTVLDQMPLLGGAARLTQPFRGGRSVDDYFTEEFEIIEGDFELGGGRVEARTLRLAYEGYEVRLEGPMDLEDLSLDMTGELLLKGDLVSAIGGLAGADVADREPIHIPLARVTHTLSDPEVEMTAETLAAVPKLLFQATGLDTITFGLGKTIGRALGGDGK